MQAFYELHVADYRNPGTAPTRQILRDNARYYGERGQVLIGNLRYRFNYIDSNAVRNNQLRWLAGPDSQLLDVAGRTSSPYGQTEVVVGAALADTLHQGAVSFRLDPASIFTNTGAALSGAVIDFGDGSAARACTPGQWVSISYATTGPKVLRYQFTYADGQQFVTYSRLYVSKAAGYASRGTAMTSVDPCWTERSFTAVAAYGGGYGKADISYYYSAGPSGTVPKPCPASNKLNVTKPVIVIDGFDHDDSRNGSRIFNEYLSYTDAGNSPQNLGAELRDNGYDVVILNPTNEYSTASGLGGSYQYISRHGGSDYMERNGLLLVSLIQELNRQLLAAGSAEPIVVVGPSMGGQIARYALSYMEANNLPHNTRLYVSLDSPHNGANIPIGLQHFIKYFATETGDYQLVQALAALDSPASLELTQHYYGMGTYFLPHPRRTAFMNAVQGFRPGGFPVDLRRVAVTNGALDGVRQRDQNGQIINDLDQAFFLEQKGTPGRSTAGVFVRWLFPFSQSFSIATRLITTASARVWYAPGNGQTNRVLRTYILGTGAHSQEAAGVANSCGLDGAPGGYRNFFSEVADGNNSSGLFQRRSFYSMRDKAVFIPMLSALAYTPTSYNNCTSLSGTDLVCTGTTPFDAYYGPVGHSEAHIQLTPENVEFMRNEILLKTPTPVFTQAPASACPAGGTFTFQVKQECTATRSGQQQPATTYNWTVTAGGTFAGNVQQLTGAGPTQAVTIAPAPSNTNVAVSVTAIRAGYATSTTVTKFIYITDAYATVAAPGEVVKYDVFDAVLDQANTTGPYTWSVSPPFKASIPNTATGPSIKVVARNAGQITISATGTDVCTGAPITALSATVTITTGGLRPAAAPAAYPNPADAVLNLATPETAEATAAPRTAVLYNAQGREVRRNSPAKAAELPTADLPAGLYYLLVEQGGHVSRSQIRVQH